MIQAAKFVLLDLVSHLMSVRHSSEDRALEFMFAACRSSRWEQRFDSGSPQVIW